MLFVFDWDGTLINSTGKIVRSMQMAAAESGLPVLDDAVVKNIIGLGLPEAIHCLYPGIDLPARLALQAAYAEVYKREDQVPCQFFPGVVECLDRLQADGHLLAVATGKSRRGLNRVLQNIGWLDRFDATRCADETASKPHPMMLFEVMDVLSVGREDTWMIGDTEYDLEMASNASVKSIGVSYGAHEASRLYRHAPVKVIDDIHELLHLINR